MYETKLKDIIMDFSTVIFIYVDKTDGIYLIRYKNNEIEQINCNASINESIDYFINNKLIIQKGIVNFINENIMFINLDQTIDVYTDNLTIIILFKNGIKLNIIIDNKAINHDFITIKGDAIHINEVKFYKCVNLNKKEG